jgi:hypothetical protein
MEPKRTRSEIVPSDRSLRNEIAPAKPGLERTAHRASFVPGMMLRLLERGLTAEASLVIGSQVHRLGSERPGWETAQGK